MDTDENDKLLEETTHNTGEHEKQPEDSIEKNMESLIENMENVSLKTTLKLDKCECSYTSVGYLKTHMKKKHGEEL